MLWQWNAGTVTTGTDQLDIDDLVSLTNTKVSDYAKAADGTRIGHMHLRVGDLVQASGFYRNTIGFDPTRERQGAAFLSAATIIISASTSGRVPAPDAATTRRRGSRGFRWRTRSRICLPPRKSGCARPVAKP